MVQTPVRKALLQEFLQQPETKPASEYIDGEIIQKPMPKTNHSIIQSDLTAEINGVLKKNKTARAMTELRCVFSGQAIIPDITVLPWQDIPGKAVGEASAEDLRIAPPWMIEILSKGQSQSKVMKKIFHALSNGSKMGWLIDSREKYVFVYQPNIPTALFELPEQTLPVPEFAAAFNLTVGELFSWLLL